MKGRKKEKRKEENNWERTEAKTHEGERRKEKIWKKNEKKPNIRKWMTVWINEGEK